MNIRKAVLAVAILLFCAGPSITAYAGKEVFERVKVHVNAVAAAQSSDQPSQQAESVRRPDSRGTPAQETGRLFKHDYEFSIPLD